MKLSRKVNKRILNTEILDKDTLTNVIEFNPIEHFRNECDEAMEFFYKGTKIEHFLMLSSWEELQLVVKISRFGGKVRVDIEVYKLDRREDNKKLLGNNFIVHDFDNFLKRFSYDLNHKWKEKEKRKNQDLIFKFLRMKANQIIESYDKTAKGEYKIKSI